MAEHRYEIQVSVKNARNESADRHFELASDKATPAEVADEVATELASSYGSELHPVETGR